jgi:hypothetical protein
MKVRLLTLAGLAIGFASPAFAQEKAATPVAPNPFQALPANPSLVQQVEAINLKFDEACNKHVGVLPQPGWSESLRAR